MALVQKLRKPKFLYTDKIYTENTENTKITKTSIFVVVQKDGITTKITENEIFVYR